MSFWLLRHTFNANWNTQSKESKNWVWKSFQETCTISNSTQKLQDGDDFGIKTSTQLWMNKKWAHSVRVGWLYVETLCFALLFWVNREMSVECVWMCVYGIITFTVSIHSDIERSMRVVNRNTTMCLLHGM